MIQRRWLRTASVLSGGVVVSFAANVALQHYLTPDFNQLIVRMFTTPVNSNDWSEVSRQWHHANLVSLFVRAPLAGLLVGIFVGALQRHQVALVAACAQVPDFLGLLWSDRIRIGDHSVSLASFLAQHSLPFIAAIVAAMVCHRILMGSRRAGSGPMVAIGEPPPGIR